jgi:hypothetical protein
MDLELTMPISSRIYGLGFIMLKSDCLSYKNGIRVTEGTSVIGARGLVAIAAFADD